MLVMPPNGSGKNVRLATRRFVNIPEQVWSEPEYNRITQHSLRELTSASSGKLPSQKRPLLVQDMRILGY